MVKVLKRSDHHGPSYGHFYMKKRPLFSKFLFLGLEGRMIAENSSKGDSEYLES